MYKRRSHQTPALNPLDTKLTVVLAPADGEVKKLVDLQAEQLNFADSVREYAIEFVESCNASGIPLTESQKQELSQVFYSMEALEKTATLGW